MQIFLALPVYNEAQALPELLGDFQRVMTSAGYAFRIIAVDDGSRDESGAILREWSGVLPIELLRHVANRGLGETISDALRRAAELAQPDDVIVAMDADNTHAPALIPEMVIRIEQGYDVVIASRYRTGSRVVGLSRFRSLMSYGARALFQALFPVRGVRDYTCGFRAYRARLLQQAFAEPDGLVVRERGFACMAEILLKVAGRGARIAEVPMVLRYDRKGGASKMPVGRTVLKTLRLMLALRFSRRRRRGTKC